MIQFSTQNVGWISAAHPPKPLSTIRLLVDALSLIHPTKLPDYHKDPFDRMLICKAMAQDLTILTNDAFIQQYPVKTLWS